MIKRHLRHNLVGYLALFVALGGTAVALPGRNSVDSRDIKPKAVHVGDLAQRAVTRAKLAPNAVTTAKVIDDSLTGADIDESTLALPATSPAAGSTPASAAKPNVLRRIVFPPGALIAVTAGAGNQGSFAVLTFSATEEQFATLSTEIPDDRVQGTDIAVRLIWSTGGAGNVFWRVQHQAVGLDEDVGAPPVKATAIASATPDLATATQFEIPGASLQNGDLLGLSIARGAAEATDTLPSAARLHLVELDYTAAP